MNETVSIGVTEASRITQYLDIDTSVSYSDVAIVFGTRLSAPAHLVAELFAQGKVDYVVLTGGTNRHDGIGEAERHLSVLLALGMPQERIILEKRSTNTLENVLFAREALDLAQIRTITAVTKWYHARRAVMTLKRHFPSGMHYYAVTYEPFFARRDNWWLSETGLKRVLKEWQSIPQYLAQGHITEIYKDEQGYT